MDVKKASLYSSLSLGAALLALVFTFLFSITLSYQSHRDGNGNGLNVLSQFLSSPMKGINLVIASPFDKGSNYYDNDTDRKLIQEMLIRYYLEMRYTFIPDTKEMLRRWGWNSPLSRISTRALHKKLAAAATEDRLRKMTASSNPIVTTVNILNITKETNFRYKVEMELNSIYTVSDQLQTDTYVVDILLGYNDSYKSFFREPVNPYGLYFIGVSHQKRIKN